jgi:hypothetical protein
MIEGMHGIVPGGGQADPVQRIIFFSQQGFEQRRRIKRLPG